MPMHDWTRVDAGIHHAFHHSWIEDVHRTLLNADAASSRADARQPNPPTRRSASVALSGDRLRFIPLRFGFGRTEVAILVVQTCGRRADA